MSLTEHHTRSRREWVSFFLTWFRGILAGAWTYAMRRARMRADFPCKGASAPSAARAALFETASCASSLKGMEGTNIFTRMSPARRALEQYRDEALGSLLCT